MDRLRRSVSAKAWLYMSSLGLGLVLIALGGPGMTVDRTIGVVVVVAAAGLLVRRASSAPILVGDPVGLRATTAPLTAWLTLGGWSRDVLVDTKARRVHIRRRAAWKQASETVIRFADIDRVDYAFRTEGDGLDTYDVSLVLGDGTRERLVSFKGEVREGDVASEEESLSRAFVRQLTAALDVGLGGRAQGRRTPTRAR